MKAYQRRNYYKPAGFMAGVVGAAVRGTLNARKKYKAGVKTKKPVASRPRRYPKTSISRTVVLNRRKKSFRENHSMENHTTSLQVKARLPSLMRLIQMQLEPQWWRVQGLTEYDTANGFYPIANRLDPSGQHILPMHIWDITSTPNTSAGGSSNPNVGHVCYFSSVAAGALAKTNTLSSQDASGATISNSIWQDENSSIGGPASLVPPQRKALHHYTHVKMNMYGVRQRATRYLVQLVMVKQEYGDFLEAADSNVEKRKIWDYLMRPFIYSNLNSGDPQVSSDIRILKTYETWISPISTDEYGGATATPHIQTLNWFIKHERLRVYDWKRGDNPDNAQNAGFDLEDGETTTRVDPKKRVYLLIRALSPSRRAANVNDAPDVITEPSYDIVIRNKFSHPR